MFPELKQQGFSILGNTVLTAFVSSHSHYSYEKAAFQLGIGTAHLIKVETDNYGKMIPEKLEAAIERSIKNAEKPFFIGCTAVRLCISLLFLPFRVQLFWEPLIHLKLLLKLRRSSACGCVVSNFFKSYHRRH